MKKVFLFLLVSLFLISFVSADVWDYSNERVHPSYPSLVAYVEVVGMYPECEGIRDGSYCVGRWYIDVSHVGDKFYIGYQISEWPTASIEGYVGQGLQTISDGRIYLNENGLFPKYILCVWDKEIYSTAHPNDWVVAGTCGGYLGEGYLRNRYHVECSLDSHCGPGESCDKSGEWSDWNCKQDLCKGVTCSNKCENSIWYQEGECIPSTGICKYDTQDNCQYGCQDEPLLSIIVGEGMCRDDPCVGVTCEDYCIGDERNTLAIGGKCINGKCTNFLEEPYAEECGAKAWYKNPWMWGGIGIFIILIVFGIWYLKKMKGGKK